MYPAPGRSGQHCASDPPSSRYSAAMRILFFQAEDGIRDIGVTGVQTCALPIYHVSDLPVPRFQHKGKVMNQQEPVARGVQRPRKSMGSFISISRTWFESEFVGYFFVSFAAFVLDLSLFSVGLRVLHMPWAASATFVFVVGVLIAYFLSIR